MNFYNDENEKKEGAPALPRAASPFRKTSAFGKSPLFSRTAGSLVDRLKNLSRRDMALVGLGLSVLVMVPVAEYMMSQPPQENLLTGGLGGKEKLGDMPYEPGVNGLSQGSADGSGEVITPLASRDPVSLILGSQPAQPAAPPPVYTPPASSMRDAMRDAGREAFSAASKNAGAPTVIPKMASGMRNMSFFGGGESSRTSGALGGGKIIDEARSASGKAAKRSMVGPVAIAGYKGVASTPNSASKGAFEKLRAAADKSAGNFAGDSAIRSLDKAAADALEIGKGGGGMGAGGDSDKTGKTSNNSTKGYEHNRSGQSLSEKAAELRQQKALEWEFYKKYEIPKQIINAIVGAVSSVLGDFIKSNLTSALGMDPPPAAKCWKPVLEDQAIIAKIAAANLGNPKGYAKAMCEALGAVQLVTSVGKDSAQGFQNTCLCGRNKTPDYGGGDTVNTNIPGGSSNPGGVPSNPGGVSGNDNTPGISTAEKTAFSEYDSLLKSVVEKTTQVQAKPDTAKDTVGPIAESFTKLSGLVTGKYVGQLNTLSGKTSSAYSAYSAKVDSALNAYSSLKPEYEAFVAKLDALPDTISRGGAGTGQIKGGIENVASGKDTAKIEKIKKLVAEWKRTVGRTYNDSAAVIQLEAPRVRAYKGQVDRLPTGVRSIGEKQGQVDSLVSGITETDPAKKITALTGQEIPTTPAAGATQGQTVTKNTAATGATGATSQAPIEGAAGLRGVKLAWTSPFDLDSKEASGNETKAWDAWVADSSKDLSSPDTMLLSLMRNKELQDAIAAGQESASASEKNFAYVKERMASFKTELVNEGVPPTYFGGTGPVKPDPVVEGGGTGNGNQPPNQEQPAAVKKVPTTALSRDVADATQNIADNVARDNSLVGAITSLPATGEASQTARQNATALTAAKQNLTAAAKKADDLAKRTEPAPTRQEITEASQNLSQARTAYNNARIAAQDSFETAKLTPSQKQTLDSYQRVLDACVDKGVGTENGAAKCTPNQSKNISTAVEAASSRINSSSFNGSSLGFVRSQVTSACHEVSLCRGAAVFNSIGCFR
jgi:hypothetical protein